MRHQYGKPKNMFTPRNKKMFVAKVIQENKRKKPQFTWLK